MPSHNIKKAMAMLREVKDIDVINLISNVLCIDEEHISVNSTFKELNDSESMELLELVMAAESLYLIELEDRIIPDLKTVQDFIDEIRKAVVV